MVEHPLTIEGKKENIGALDGIRVIDLSRVLAGPYCTMLLGDMGADVIKVEQPKTGDISRQWGPPWVGSESAYFLSANRNKRSITIDLKCSMGQSILKKLIGTADVVVENFLPGTTEKFGLDYPTLEKGNPGLVYCSITGYGQTGPKKDIPGFDFVIQAEGGIMSITGPAEGSPFKIGIAAVDLSTAMYANSAILAALFYRSKTGLGQYIDVSLFDSQIASLTNVAHNYFASEKAPQRYGNAHANIVPYEVFTTHDGNIALAVGTDQQFKNFCEAVGRSDLWEDGRFCKNSDRVKYRDILIPEIQKTISNQNSEEIIFQLKLHKVPAGPINDIPAALRDTQTISRKMVQEIEHPITGIIKQLGHVAKYSKTTSHIYSAPPLLGEHTKTILQELGYLPSEITDLISKDVI